jgi:F-type H+-transporting ATPase subunit a
MLSAGGVLTVLHLLPLVVIFAIVGLELAIAFLQAYVFTVLLCIYLNDAISLH